ncbi:AAA family ATPase [Thalassovita aquimarina]|uniref:AAA family ATPase n=1 Tax=Thalassovita aquimarina TaxID=2785917 RepID=UPI0035661DDA
MNLRADESLSMSKQPNIQLNLVNGPGAVSTELEGLLEANRRILFSAIDEADLNLETHLSNADVTIANLSGLNGENVDFLNKIRGLAPEMPLIVTTPPLSPQETRILFKFNVLDWLPSPVGGDELMDSIFKGVRARKTHDNRVHAVVSTVGGAGATTMAVSMADLAATKLFSKKGTVALFDLDFSTGNCGFVVNMVSNFNLANVVATPRRVDGEFIRVIRQQHEHGFYLYSFKRPELNTDLNGYELVLRMLDAVSAEHEQVFLDIPYYETEWKDDVLAAVNTLTLVTELNLPAIKHTLELVERIKRLRGDDFPVQVVFNKWESRMFGQRIGTRRLKELFGDTPLHYVPQAGNLIGESIDRGVPPSDISAHSKYLRALQNYMKHIELEEPVR